MEPNENKLSESEEKLNKFKALAVKLKKELTEAKEQIQKSNSECNSLKSQLKNAEKDKEKISTAHQQIVKNFQSLQEEYDKIQDEHETAKKQLKNAEQDLNNTLVELTKIREEFAETKNDLDKHKKQLINLNSVKAELENKNKEYESKIIVLTSELDSEKKKIIAQTGLEQSVAELHNQLDYKTTEIVELYDKFEKIKEFEKENQTLHINIEELNKKLQEEINEKNNLFEQNKEFREKLENNILQIEQNKIVTSELHLKMQSLQNELTSIKDEQAEKIDSYETKIKKLEDELKTKTDELKKKDEEYENYKFRVCKVFKQQVANQNENDSKRVKELEEEIDKLNKEKENLISSLGETIKEKDILSDNIKKLNTNITSLQGQINQNNELTKQFNVCLAENEKLKNMSRELQASIVNERLKLEKSHKEKIEEIENANKSIIKNLEEELRLVKKKLNEKEIEQKNEKGANHKYNINLNSVNSVNSDDLESVETISLPAKRLSVSSNSFVVNPLEEILNSIDNQDQEKSYQNFTIHLTEAQNKVENLTQLLEESESNNLLLTEQNRVLKSEIRRLQRSVDRLEIAENLEYLKNILLKFLSLSGGDERQRLIPVLTTILKLSPDEQNLLQNTATNDSIQNQSKWSNYLYNWSGNR